MPRPLSTFLVWLHLLFYFGASGYFAWQELAARQRSVVVTGRVAELTPMLGSSRSHVQQVEYAFGEPPQHYRVRGLLGTLSRGSLGAEVPVHVDPGNPGEGRIGTFWQSWGLSLLAAGLGLATAAWMGIRRWLSRPSGATPPGHSGPGAGSLPQVPFALRRKPANRFERLDSLSLVGYLLLAMTGLAFGGPGLQLAWTEFESRLGTVTVMGTVVGHYRTTERDGKDRYQLKVDYEVRGSQGTTRHSARGELRWHRPFGLGQTLPVQVRPEAPGQGKVGGFLESVLFPSILLGVASGALGLLAWLLAQRLRRARTARYLQQHGTAVRANLMQVRHLRQIRINRHYSPWIIHACWWHPTTAVQHRFQSHFLWHDPTEPLKRLGHVPMLVDPADPKRLHHFCLDQLE